MKKVEQFLKERTQIATALNFKNDYAVLELDVAKVITLGGEVCGYEGCKIRMDFGDNYYHTGKINYWKDTKQLPQSHGQFLDGNVVVDKFLV